MTPANLARKPSNGRRLAVRRTRVPAWVVGALLALIGVQGCRHPAPIQEAAGMPWPYAPGERPRFCMVYLPYVQNGAPLAMASPYVYGWTDARMERDVSRLVAAGLDGLILGLQPAVLSDVLQTERVNHFVDLIESKGAGSLSLTLMFVPPSAAEPTSIEAETIGRWLATHDLLRRPSLVRRDGRIVVVFSREVTLVGPPHPALYAVRAGLPGASWTWGDPADPARTQPTGPERQVLVYAGWRGRTAPVDTKGRPLWELERRGGLTLATEIQNACRAGAGLICISSWNNYVNGDFIEPNSLDRDAVLAKLTAAIRHAREAAQLATPQPALPPTP